jgi:hypothetical protein
MLTSVRNSVGDPRPFDADPADPYLRLVDPDPTSFFIDFKEVKKLIFFIDFFL